MLAVSRTLAVASLLGVATVAAAQSNLEDAVTTGDLAVPATYEPLEQTGNVEVADLDDAGRWGSDAYELIAADIADDSLTATISYGGGCRDHAFTLVLSDAVMMMDPVRLPARLVHEADRDPCEAWLTETVEFDLTPVRQLIGGSNGSGGTVVLMVSFADGSEREFVYAF